MNASVVIYSQDTPAKVISDLLSRVPIRRVAIVEDNRPKGVACRGNLVRWLRNEAAMRAHQGG